MDTLALIHNYDLYRACEDVERRLPPAVRQALAHVKVYGSDRPRGVADAGHADIRVKTTTWCDHGALVAVIAHECGHLYARHYERLDAGEITREDAEREADAFVTAWGFTRELARRRDFYGT